MHEFIDTQMTDGEGTGRVASEAAPPDPAEPWGDQISDASSPPPSPSRYSSCGESELERYCSANSIMGTPSVCSTSYHDFAESEFGSTRSFGLGGGDDHGGLENFSLEGRSETNREEARVLGDKRIEFGKASGGSDGNDSNLGGSGGFELYGGDELGFLSEANHGAFDVNELMSWKVGDELSERLGVSVFNNDSDRGDSGEDDEEGSIGSRGIDGIAVTTKSAVDQMSAKIASNSDGAGNGSQFVSKVSDFPSILVPGEEDSNCFDGLRPESDLQRTVNELEREEEATSSRNEHSEDEDSMYNYGTDDEGKSGHAYDRSLSYAREGKAKNENPLLINSSVAFGSDDWDDFEQEREGSTLESSSFIRSDSQNQERQNVETERKLFNSVPVASVGFPITSQMEQGNDTINLPSSSSQFQCDSKLVESIDGSVGLMDVPNVGEQEEVENVRDIPVASCQVQATDDLVEFTKSYFTTSSGFPNVHEPEQEDVREIPFDNNQLRRRDELFLKDTSVANVFKTEQNPEAEKLPEKMVLNIMGNDMRKVHQNMTTGEVIKVDDYQNFKNQESGNLKVKLDPLADISISRPSSHSTTSPTNIGAKFIDAYKPNPTHSKDKMGKNPPASSDHVKHHLAAVKVRLL